MDNLLSDSKLSISQYYEGRNIFVTGGTGFMGKILLEKLLRSCPGIDKIYVLTRSKRGESPQNRIKEMLKGPLYKPLEAESPNILKKVIAIRGDVTEPNLGISSIDEEIIANSVSVIFHVAATVKFDDELANAIKMNVKGTQSMIELARKISNLSSFVHVSTAYSHCYQSWNSKTKMEEKFYPMPMSKYNSYSPDELIAIYEDAKSDGHDKTKDILGVFPNTYVFTKAWAENVVMQSGQGLPIVMMRPSIVTAAWKEPVAGWVDNLNGPTGILAAAGVGLMQTMYAKRYKRADLIPVDIACNMLCVLAWKAGNTLSQGQKIDIYNCTSGESAPVTWGHVEKAMGYFTTKYPLENMIWYPYACSNGILHPLKNNKLADRVCRILFHWLPAYVIDMVCYIARVKNVSRVKLTEKMTKAMKVLEYFSTKEWYWDTKNVGLLYDTVHDTDKKVFSFTFQEFEGWDQYLENTIKGTREFAMKSDPTTIDNCKSRLKKFYISHQVLKIMLLAMFYLLLCRIFGNFFTELKMENSV